jgi:hypothetical protein
LWGWQLICYWLEFIRWVQIIYLITSLFKLNFQSSFSTSFALYYISLNPEIQKKMFKEAKKILPNKNDHISVASINCKLTNTWDFWNKIWISFSGSNLYPGCFKRNFSFKSNFCWSWQNFEYRFNIEWLSCSQKCEWFQITIYCINLTILQISRQSLCHKISSHVDSKNTSKIRWNLSPNVG